MTQPDRYEYWRHERSGEVYATRLTPLGLVTGSCGPLDYTEHLQPEPLPNYHYDDDPDCTDWIAQHEDQFYLYQPVYTITD